VQALSNADRLPSAVARRSHAQAGGWLRSRSR